MVDTQPHPGQKVVLCGWDEKALETCRVTARVTERNWVAGRIRSDELVFDADW